MKKILGILSWIIALAGSISVGLCFLVVENDIVMITGFIAMILGIIGIIIFNRKNSPLIERLLDIIDIFDLLS